MLIKEENMETFRDMIMQYKDVQNVVFVFAAIGAIAVLYVIIKIIWKLHLLIRDRIKK